MKEKIVGILVVTLLIATAVLPVVGTINVGNNQREEKNIQLSNSPKSSKLPMLPPFILEMVNGDWNYWSKSPNVYCIPAFTGDEYIGEVGIGTDDPQCKLDVRGPTSIQSWRSGLGGRDSILYVEAINGTEDYYYQIRTVSHYGTNFVITNSGKVGIGTDTPGDYKLFVQGKAAAPSGWYSQYFKSYGGNYLYIDAGDNGADITINPSSGKVSIPGGIDPPYVSYSKESHESIREFAQDVEDHEEVMQFWSGESHRMEIYVISEDAFYTLTGELIG